MEYLEYELNGWIVVDITAYVYWEAHENAVAFPITSQENFLRQCLHFRQ